jgi:hypothetical protein
LETSVESILANAKKAYKESVAIGSIEIQELLLSILTDVIKLQEPTKFGVHKPKEKALPVDTPSRDIDTIAYVFSEYEHRSLFPDKSQADAIRHVSQLLNVKYNTFRNKRDAFDRHTNSKRKGWDRELSEPLQRILDKYKNLSQKKVIKRANTIINKYENKTASV